MTEKRYSLNILKNYSRSLDEVWEWLEKNLDFQLEKKIGFEKVNYVINKNDNTIVFIGRTVNGTMFVSEGILKISLTIPLLYRFFIPRIKKAILSVFKEL